MFKNNKLIRRVVLFFQGFGKGFADVFGFSAPVFKLTRRKHRSDAEALEEDWQKIMGDYATVSDHYNEARNSRDSIIIDKE